MTNERIDKICYGCMSFWAVFILFVCINNLAADEMVHKFKSPSFNGNNTSSHYLTIENQEFNRKMTIKEELKALQEQIKRDKENTTLARFIRNLESRIYAEGTIELEGNTISYISDGDIITLTITDADGNVTVIQLPIGSFTF